MHVFGVCGETRIPGDIPCMERRCKLHPERSTARISAFLLAEGQLLCPLIHHSAVQCSISWTSSLDWLVSGLDRVWSLDFGKGWFKVSWQLNTHSLTGPANLLTVRTLLFLDRSTVRSEATNSIKMYRPLWDNLFVEGVLFVSLSWNCNKCHLWHVIGSDSTETMEVQNLCWHRTVSSGSTQLKCCLHKLHWLI